MASISVKGEEKRKLVERLLKAKKSTGKTFTEIAKQLGVTNVYCAQLFHNQAQLKPETAKIFREVVPQIEENDLKLIQEIPFRCYDPSNIQEPLIYRLNEGVNHYGEGIKAIVNEEFGDGIMSTVDVIVKVEKQKGKSGEDRVVLTFSGKYLPHPEQKIDN